MVLSNIDGENLSEKRLTRDEIGNQAKLLLSEFVIDRMKVDGVEGTDCNTVVANLAESGALVLPDQKNQIRNIAGALKRIGDDLDRDRNLQKMIQKLSIKNPEETFSQVAHEIFIDGIYNWGRVVTLFYFAYKMIIRAIKKQVDIIKSIIRFVINFITDHIAAWIIERGGWEAVFEYFGATGYQVAMVLSVGIFLSILVYWKCSKS